MANIDEVVIRLMNEINDNYEETSKKLEELMKEINDNYEKQNKIYDKISHGLKELRDDFNNEKQNNFPH